MKLTKYPFHGMIDSNLNTFKVKPSYNYGYVDIMRVTFSDPNELPTSIYSQISIMYESDEVDWDE